MTRPGIPRPDNALWRGRWLVPVGVLAGSLPVILALFGFPAPAASGKDAAAFPDSISLVQPGEEGRPLIVRGRVRDRATGRPVPGARIYLYHTDARGEYHPSDPIDESTARLSGELASDSAGRFTVRTILPGEYGPPGSRHIHLHYVRAAGYEQKGGVILFDSDVTDDLRRWARETGFGTIITLEDQDELLKGTVEIRLDPD